MKNLFFVFFLFTHLFYGEISHANGNNGSVKIQQQNNQMKQQNSIPNYLYKIASPEEWQKSQIQNKVQLSEMDKDFIHLATESQLPRITQKYWANKPYIILKLDSKKLIGHFRNESNPGGTTLYYHLYEGTIPLEAVVNVSKVYNQ